MNSEEEIKDNEKYEEVFPKEDKSSFFDSDLFTSIAIFFGCLP